MTDKETQARLKKLIGELQLMDMKGFIRVSKVDTFRNNEQFIELIELDKNGKLVIVITDFSME